MATVTIKTNGKNINVEQFTPPAARTPKGVVVIAYGADGLRDVNYLFFSTPWKTMIEGYAKALAANGIIALIPDYLASTGISSGPLSSFIVLGRAGSDGEIWQQAIADCMSYAEEKFDVSRSNIGLLGFSLGGYLCLRLRDKVDFLVEYFAPENTGLGGIKDFKNSNLRAQIHHGTADRLPGTSFSNAESIADKLEKEGSGAVKLFSYRGAGHGFVGNRPANKDAREKSKKRTLDFFETNF